MAKFYTSYKLTGIDVADIAAISKHYGNRLIALTHDGEVSEFVATIMVPGGIERHAVRVTGERVELRGRTDVVAA